MTAIVAGVYKQGKIEFLETPKGLREGRVRVVLIEDEAPVPARRYLVRGKYKGSQDTPAFNAAHAMFPLGRVPL